MALQIPEASLPNEISPFAAVEAAYPAELLNVIDSLNSCLPVLIESEKELTPFIYKCVRDRLKKNGKKFVYLDGRTIQGMTEPPMGAGLVGTIVHYLRECVRGVVDDQIVVLPHLDLLTTSNGGLTSEAREVITLLYENPGLMFLGFKDPSFPLPCVISNLFPRHQAFLGVARERLASIVTQRESRKLSRGVVFDPYELYKHVSGIQAVRLRRLLSSLKGEDYPTDNKPVYKQLRQATLVGSVTLPNVDLDKDIGGYDKVKKQLKEEILDLLTVKDAAASEAQIKEVESLIPRGMIFWGPPGTGKTYIAKAMATALGAAVTVVSGPELKSKWVGESEENLRRVFAQARQAAPAVIIFDELDSFAQARGMYQGSGVEHSMVNQLLTEMDGFRKDELVFIVGTTNFVESLDPALLRPGRFEFHIEIPYPNADDRKAIFSIYDEKMGLKMSKDAMEFAVKETAGIVEETNTHYSGDHLQALCRTLARMRIREKRANETTIEDVEKAMKGRKERATLSPKEEHVIATHEAGHAVVAMFCPDAPVIERISIKSDIANALGYVQYKDDAHKYVTTQKQLLDRVCALYGGREAEMLFFGDLSTGSVGDIDQATSIARALIEDCGFGSDLIGSRRSKGFDQDNKVVDPLSENLKMKIEDEVRVILATQKKRAQEILSENKALVATLRDLLVEKKTIDAKTLGEMKK
jgi:cell division protease FtsH